MRTCYSDECDQTGGIIAYDEILIGIDSTKPCNASDMRRGWLRVEFRPHVSARDVPPIDCWSR
jgi:hypothetical protein